MRAVFVAFFSTVFGFLCTGQQPAQYSLYRYNLSAINPAYAGSEGVLNASAVVRQQWAGLAGSPQSQFINVDLPLDGINSGAGWSVENDRLGLQQTIQAAMAYSFFIRTGKLSKFSVGIRGGMGLVNWNGSIIRTPDGIYGSGLADHKDEILPGIPFSGRFPILDVGVVYQRNFVKLGFGMKNLTQSSIKYTINNGKIRLVTNYFFTFATEFTIRDQIKLFPSAFFRTDLIENQLDITFITEMFRKFNIGVGYRGWNRASNDALNIIAGMRLNDRIRLFYAYDINLSPLKNSNSGSHELLLHYKLNTSIGKAIPERIIYNARYF